MSQVRRLRLSGIKLLALVSGLLLGGPACSQPQPNAVLVVVVDTWRFDHLGVYGYSRPTTPKLDRWSQDAAIFEQAWSTSSWTLPAMASMLTGLYPDAHGAGQLLPTAQMPIPAALAPDFTTLPQVLLARGWSTLAVVNNPFLHQRFGLSRGFQLYDYAEATNEKLRRADQSVDRLLGRLDQIELPFFALLHLFDPHLAYDPPAAYRGRFTQPSFSYPVRDLKAIRERAPAIPQAEARFIESAYDEELAFVDQQLGRLFDGLQDLGLSDRLLVILTSDHGEEFFEHDGFEHGHSLHSEVVRTPLLIKGPGVRSGRYPEPVSLSDLAPTILEAFSLPSVEPTDGVSLWELTTAGARLPRRTLKASGILWGSPQDSLLQWPFRLLIEPDLDRVRLYQVEDDPLEHDDLSSQHPRVLQDLLRHWEETRRSPPAWNLPQLDQDTLEQLRSLGYIH